MKSHFSTILKKASENPSFFKDRFRTQLERAEAENGQLNCFLQRYLSSGQLEQVFASIVEKKKGASLFGLTAAVKDCFAVRGQELTWGLQPAAQEKADEHAAIVEQLVAAGVSLVGSTNLDPAALGTLGENPYYGNTNQSRFKERIPGGSSAGSAVAVAAQLCDFALGSDMAGSVRVPAAACGIAGMRCSSTVFSKKGSLLAPSPIDSIGFLAKHASDIQLLLTLLSKERAAPTPAEPVFITCSNTTTLLLDSFAKEQYATALRRLQAVSHYEENSGVDFRTAQSLLKDCLALVLKDHFESLSLPQAPKAIQALLSYAHRISASAQEERRDQRAIFTQQINSILGPNRYIVTPTLPALPPGWKHIHREKEQQVLAHFNVFLSVANICDLPAVSIALSTDERRFPFSLQIIGSQNSDLALLDAATTLQDYFYAETTNEKSARLASKINRQ